MLEFQVPQEKIPTLITEKLNLMYRVQPVLQLTFRVKWLFLVLPTSCFLTSYNNFPLRRVMHLTAEQLFSSDIPNRIIGL